MIIGFIGFGKVSQNLVGIIRSDDIDFITSKEANDIISAAGVVPVN